MPIESVATHPPEILVEWEFPIDRLAPVDSRYRTRLAALPPVSSHRLELVVDKDSGYEMVGQPEKEPFVPFFTGEQWPETTFFGSRNISLKEKVAAGSGAQSTLTDPHGTS
jgi:hypothetical protein